jgi:hypothetical protein
MSFKKKKYLIIKKAISKDLANFIYNYFLMKRQVAQTFFKHKYISPFATEWGVWNDVQVPDTYSHYADIAMETLLLKLQPLMEEKTKLKLVPNYSYARIYKNNDVLNRHKDRFSCEISTTINLGGDLWPIYLEPNKNVGMPNGKEITSFSNNKGIKVILKQGDMLIYKGTELEHWREPFTGNECAQVFLHYNDINLKPNNENIYDGRIHLGLPGWFKNIQND